MIDPKVVEALAAARSRSDASPLVGPTQREREILGEIATLLFLADEASASAAPGS